MDKLVSLIPEVVDRNRRTFLTNRENLSLGDIKYPNQQEDGSDKPSGVWYGFGMNWVEFVTKEIPVRRKKYLYEFEVDTSNMIILNSVKDVTEFTKEYISEKEHWMSSLGLINWERVSEKYSGIELPTYHSSLRYKSGLHWYYPWDIASGCFWDSSVLKSITLMGKLEDLEKGV